MPQLHVIFDPHDKVQVPSIEWQHQAKAVCAVVPVDPDNLRACIDDALNLILKNIEGVDGQNLG